MDCRRWVRPALLLACGAWGCSHNNTPTVPVIPQQPTAATTPVTPPPGAVVKKESDLPKRMPKAATCVAAGEFHAGEAASLDPTSAAAEMKRNQARLAYQQALSLDPKHLPAYQGLARLYLAMDDVPHAVETYHKALDVYPKNAGLWFDLGMVQARTRDWPAATESLNKAVQLDPENRRYVNTLGFTLARAGRWPDALSCFTRVQGEARAHYSLARMLEHLGQSDKAREQLRQALHVDPNLEPASEMLARLEGGAAPAPEQPPSVPADVPTPPQPQAAAPAPTLVPVVFTEARPLPQEK